MYPRIPSELVADPLEYAEHSLGTTAWSVLFGTRFCHTPILCIFLVYEMQLTCTQTTSENTNFQQE
jgi:hypothetical protein